MATFSCFPVRGERGHSRDFRRQPVPGTVDENTYNISAHAYRNIYREWFREIYGRILTGTEGGAGWQESRILPPRLLPEPSSLGTTVGLATGHLQIERTNYISR